MAGKAPTQLMRLTRLLQGGAYLTLLNTIANMGAALPKLAIFAVMDLLSDRACVGAMDKVKGCPKKGSFGEGAPPLRLRIDQLPHAN